MQVTPALPAMQAPESRLFSPGDGASPPTLAGREEEKQVLSRCLSDLAGGRSPPHNVVLVGPRGNGKTALLGWFERLCGESAVKVDVAMLTPADVPDHATLLARLAPPTGLARLLPRKVGVSSVASAEWAAGDTSRSLTEKLIARCRRRPFVVLLDEAHVLDLEVGGALLNASQQVRPKAPFLLVLAGTPGLLAHLGQTNATFWDRLGSGLLGIGRLSEAATKEALVAPAATRNVRIDADALDSVVAHSQCYAYFIQLWGEALWDQHLASGANQLTAEHVQAASPAVEKRTTEYYQRRYRELEAQALLPAAMAVATAFRDGANSTATDQGIDAALATTGMDGPARFAAREGLDRLGYIWCPPGQLPPVVWHPGIPSLMQYVLDQVTQSANAGD